MGDRGLSLGPFRDGKPFPKDPYRLYIYIHVHVDCLAGPFPIAVSTPLQAGPESSPHIYIYIRMYVCMYVYIYMRLYIYI